MENGKSETKKGFNWILLLIVIVVILLIDFGLQWWSYCQLMTNIMEAEARLGMHHNWISMSDFLRGFYSPFRSPVMLSHVL
jgi:flagellar basal body-associated protein FliL